MVMQEFLAVWWPSGAEWIVIAIVALLLFGKRLPEVARSMGKGVVEFKKGLKGIEDEAHDIQHDVASHTDPSEYTPPEKSYTTEGSSPNSGSEPPK